MKKRKIVQALIGLLLVAALVLVPMACKAPEVTPTQPTVPTEPTPPPPPIPGEEYPEEILIGCPLHMTGPLASVGMGQKIGLDLACEEINEQGGIKSMGGAKLRVLTPDTQTVPDIAISETERLITDEGVVMVIPTYMHGEEVAFVSQRLKTPAIQFQTIMPPEMSEEDEYIYRLFNDEPEDFFDNQDAYTLFNKEKGVPGPHTIAFLYCDDIWCTEAYAWGPPMFKDWGYEVVLEEPYTCGQATFKPQIAKIKAAAPDHLILFMHTAGHIIFNREAMEEELYMPYGICTQGGEDSLIYATLPPESYEYMFIHEDGDIWFAKMCYGKKLAERHQEEMGYELATYVTNVYQGMWIVKSILERTEYSSDLQTFRDNFLAALAVTDISIDNCPDPQTCADGTKWCPQLVRGCDELQWLPSGHTLPRQGHGQISQIIGGVRVPMWPLDMRPAEYKDALVWPIPPWSER